MLQIMWPGRHQTRPETGLSGRVRGSETQPRMPAFCAIPAGGKRREKNVSTEETGGGKLTGRKHSFRWGSLNDRNDRSVLNRTAAAACTSGESFHDFG